MSSSLNLPALESAALALLNISGELTIRSYHAQHREVSRRSLQRVLQGLVETGQIQRSGTAPRVVYRLPPSIISKAPEITLRAIKSIMPYAANPRRISSTAVSQVAASIHAFGFKQPIVVDSNSVIVVGHTRLLAAQQLGLTQVPVLVASDLSPTQAQAYRLADNRTAQETSWDDALLVQELQSLLAQEEGKSSFTGFTPQEIAQLRRISVSITQEEDNKVLPEARCKPGQLWQLGRHRLLCGDATNPEDVERLLGSQTADLGLSDPPYNVDYTGHTSQKMTLKGDKQSPQDFCLFLEQIFKHYYRALSPSASLYVFHPTLGSSSFQKALEDTGFSLRSSLVWAKQHFAWGGSRYKYQHEPFYYCHKTGEIDAWYGDKSQSTLWSLHKPQANRLHPTMKPIALMERALQNSSQVGDNVVDLLAGSGSTLIASERLERNCYALEIDPHYCDVILQRWETESREKATLLT